MKTSANWERIRALFHAALEQPADARVAFLSRVSEGDENTRREVESLLAAHDASDGFLESPAVDLGVAVPPQLEAGDRVGNFEVIGSLGAGGMGEVYRARDVQLRREVAIKLLPRALADDPRRLTRFERESRILAALNHPHIATIHSIEHADGLHALVMELVEGPTLADRLQRGRLDWRDALVLGRALAGALEAAHDKGVVHRDLKPANIKFSSSGRLKLLDFGLAKELADQDAAVAPTARQPADVLKTADGLILGTCAYMSPEQARGLPVDKRTDVWAFGCLLFEMLAGRRVFAGETVSETMTAVLEREPDWPRLPEETPQTVRRLLRRCLEKDPHHRLHDIADARIEIDDALAAKDNISQPSTGSRVRKRVVMVASILAVSAGFVALGWWLRNAVGNEVSVPVARSTWALPTGLGLDSSPAVSLDGKHVAFTALGGGTSRRLFVRPFSSLEARAIPGTEGARHPFWSPDGRSLAYFAPGRLMKVAIDGGAPVEICNAMDGRGGAWSTNGVIVFSSHLIGFGLSRVPAEGGRVEPATLLDTAQGENSHRWPVILPDGIHFLYFVRSIRAERRGVYVGRVDRAAAVPGAPLFQSESEALYASLDRAGRGVLLSPANGRLEVRRFDARQQRLVGDPTTVDLPVSGSTPYHPSMFSISDDVLAYVSSPIPWGQRLASIERNGEHLKLWEERASINWPRLSPDGRKLVYQRIEAMAGSLDLWVEDLERGSRLRITEEGAGGGLAVWSRDGRQVAYLTGMEIGKSTIVIAAADGTSVSSSIPCPGTRCLPTDWSPDGRSLLANVYGSAGVDVWTLPIGSDGTSRPLLAESYVERDGRLSPDARLVAYVSEQSGRPEVSVHTVDGPLARDVLSVGGGDQPVWSRDGRELFFVDPQGSLSSVPVRWAPDGRPEFGRAVPLDVPRIGSGHLSTQYDVSPDGRRIYFLDRHIDSPPSEISMVVGWRALLN